MRNTKIIDVVSALEDNGITVTIHDSWADPAEVKHEFGLINHTTSKFDAVALGVVHKQFLDLDISTLVHTESVIYDVKGILEHKADAKL